MALRIWGVPGGAVGVGEVALFAHGHAGVAAVRRVPQHDQDLAVLLDAFGGEAFVFEFGKRALLTACLVGIPPREGVREVDGRAVVLRLQQRRLHFRQEQPDLQVRHDVRRSQDFEPEDALAGGLAQELPGEGAAALLHEPVADEAKHRHDVRARSAARVQHQHVVGREAVGDVQLFPQHRVDAVHHVLDDLRRRVPHAQVLTQRRVEALQERLVEVLYGLFLLKLRKEGRAVDAVEGVGRPVHDLQQPEPAQLAGGDHLQEEAFEERHAQVLRRAVPVERVLAGRVFAVPQYPRAEHAVEERLHDR